MAVRILSLHQSSALIRFFALTPSLSLRERVRVRVKEKEMGWP
jgi:hypothetical protein